MTMFLILGLLIATDVAARGLDIPNIDHVIHYQVPQHSDIYDLKFYLCSMRFRYLVFFGTHQLNIEQEGHS